ncbi:MAG: DUF1223 domain-containing protein [Sphingomonadaceae bacterium]
MRLRFALPAIALLSAAVYAQPASVGATPVAIELFTSQGCSSCPPADELVEQLAKEPNIIVFTRPVTYWDRLGWKDTLAREENTELQRAYAARGGVGSGVYTPQAMVQGQTAAVGSDRAAVRRLIAAQKANPGPAISATITADGGRSVSINQNVRANAAVSLVALKGNVVVRIGSGENGGRTVRYTNIVVAETPVGRWSGGAATIPVSGGLMKRAGADRYALILREGSAGRIIAARYL